MENSIEGKSQFSNPLFVRALVFSLALGFIRGIQGVLIYLFMFGGLDFASYSVLVQVPGIIAFPIINPILIMLGFYKLGGNVYPKISLALVARLTIAGNFVGYFSARLLTQLIIPESLILYFSNFQSDLYTPFSLFFIEFTAFAIAWIKLLKRSTPQEPGSMPA
ncbi:MAG: hypothetical protein ACFFBS_01880 [Promethearchaeota archaeon]